MSEDHSDVRVGQVGLGAWGANLVRNVDEAAQLVWICDVSEERVGALGRRHPGARTTTSSPTTPLRRS